MHNASISLKEKRKINVPTEFYFTNILLNFYFLAFGPSNIDFPSQFTPEIDIRSFFQFPVPPCQLHNKNRADKRQSPYMSAREFIEFSGVSPTEVTTSSYQFHCQTCGLYIHFV